MKRTIRTERERHIVGLQIRTKNSDEANPSTARIGRLWRHFFEQDLASRLPNKVPGSPLYAVYGDYESDAHGEYSMTLGYEVTALGNVPAGMVAITIPARAYAVFPVSRPEPRAIQETWRDVWAEFDGGSAQRVYTVDFEQYESAPDGGPGDAAIYIAVAD